ncbi:MAG: hypothetical protein PHE15_05720 [Dehalococcoidales bacterium]|nr:hypothetical protein [Dehalococcoidales bacterium]
MATGLQQMAKRSLAVVVILGCLTILLATAAQQISLTDQEAEWIGNKIFCNECGGKDKCLITWNEGEDFISLGIGHCIWYPEGKEGPFDESFPKLLKFIKENGRELPGWLKNSAEPHCPWQSKDEYLQDINSPKVTDFRNFLKETKDLQLLFIVNRLQAALPKILQAAPEADRPRIERQFYRMASTSAGIYALVDYVNFSGEGVLATVRYNGRGWGLLQVLGRLGGAEGSEQAICEFVWAAEDILTERVNNSPPGRNEQKWLCGWKKRLNTYIQAMAESPAQ